MPESADLAGMSTESHKGVAHPQGEQPPVEMLSAIADTFAGRVHVEWDTTAPVTPFGQLPFFIDYLKQAGLFGAWVADCPLWLTSPNAPNKRDLLGTVLLSVLAGHWRYAHITSLRCDPVNPPLLGMSKVASEDSVRRNLEKIDEAKGLAWLQNHLDYCTAPMLGEPWVLDMDSTVKTLYGHQEGAEVGYNPHKPGRPSHAYHTYMLSSLRLVLRVDVLPGNEYNVAHATDGLWSLLDHLGPARRPSLLRGDNAWGIERVMGRAEQAKLAYLFRLRLTANVKRSLERAMQQSDWADAGQGWQGKETSLRLVGWSRQRRIILLRRKLTGDLATADRSGRSDRGQLQLGLMEVGPDLDTWEYAALVTSLDSEILTLGQLYRDRADCENVFDELKNQWGWGGFTTQDLKRCQLLARTVALIYNWWSLFVRLADPEHHREAITTRPLLLSAIARKTQHAGQMTLTVSSMHGARDKACRAYMHIAGFLDQLRKTAEQLDPLQRWYRILSEALRHFLKGRQLQPPIRLNPA
jgi:Transposase DDE domain group 1